MLDAISEVLIEHGPHAVTQAWQAAGWLASRLGWTYQASKIQPQRRDRLPVPGPARPGPAPDRPAARRPARDPPGPGHRRPGGKLGVLDFASEGDGRLSVAPEGVEVAARTVTVQPQRIAELIGRQLSDREPDPVFRESMKVAQQLARHVVS